jgi:hypothetical protein
MAPRAMTAARSHAGIAPLSETYRYVSACARPQRPATHAQITAISSTAMERLNESV